MQTQTVKERPILFSGEMVKAILDGRKTQTRRVMKVQPRLGVYGNGEVISPDYYVLDISSIPVIPLTAECKHRWVEQSPYGIPGDRLWVRETFAEGFDIDNSGPDQSERRIDHQIIYRADGDPELFFEDWKPSIFMYRSASRINLEITNVRVERLNDISESDARAEGYEYTQLHAMHEEAAGMSLMAMPDDPQLWFRTLWDKINGKKHSWSSNPWVWVIEFKKCT